MRIDGARKALEGHDECGDVFAWWRDGAIWTICLIDGLGHGADAAAAAEAALVQTERCRYLPCDAIIGVVDDGIRRSRGAAMSVVQVDAVTHTMAFAGVGNVRAAIFGDPVLRFEGTPGIVGTGRRLPPVQRASWRDGDLLLLWTDGFSAYLDVDQAGRRQKGDPLGLANQLIDRFSKGHDDAGVICCLLESEDA